MRFWIIKVFNIIFVESVENLRWKTPTVARFLGKMGKMNGKFSTLSTFLLWKTQKQANCAICTKSPENGKNRDEKSKLKERKKRKRMSKTGKTTKSSASLLRRVFNRVSAFPQASCIFRRRAFPQRPWRAVFLPIRTDFCRVWHPFACSWERA